MRYRVASSLFAAMSCVACVAGADEPPAPLPTSPLLSPLDEQAILFNVLGLGFGVGRIGLSSALFTGQGVRDSTGRAGLVSATGSALGLRSPSVSFMEIGPFGYQLGPVALRAGYKVNFGFSQDALQETRGIVGTALVNSISYDELYFSVGTEFRTSLARVGGQAVVGWRSVGAVTIDGVDANYSTATLGGRAVLTHFFEVPGTKALPDTDSGLAVGFYVGADVYPAFGMSLGLVLEGRFAFGPEHPDAR